MLVEKAHELARLLLGLSLRAETEGAAHEAVHVCRRKQARALISKASKGSTGRAALWAGALLESALERLEKIQKWVRLAWAAYVRSGVNSCLLASSVRVVAVKLASCIACFLLVALPSAHGMRAGLLLKLGRRLGTLQAVKTL